MTSRAITSGSGSGTVSGGGDGGVSSVVFSVVAVEALGFLGAFDEARRFFL